MKIIDIINGPWAITTDMLGEIRSIYAKHLRGEKIDIAKIEAATGKQLKNRPQGYETINGSAIIPIQGVIAKRMNLFMDISGGASTQLIERDIKDALADPEVKQIILHMDSPGGTIDGTFELANFIFENRGTKPIIAYTDGIMMSAAYAIGSAADRIFISGNTAMVGSIGVVTAHEDVSGMEEKMGIKTTEIYSGKYKRIATQYSPLSEEGRASIQGRIDYLFSIFVDEVAKFRGVSSETVLSNMATSVKDYFIGQEAISSGLVDGVSTLDRLINNPAENLIGLRGVVTAGGGPAVSEKNKNKEAEMTLAELKEKQPELYKAVFDEGKTRGIEDTECPEHCKEESKKEGAKAETTRIKAVRAQSIPGHEALIETLMFDGVTTGEQAAVKVLASEKALRENKLKAFQEEGKEIKVPVSEEEKPSGSAVDQNLPVEEKAKAEWDKTPALRAEFGDFKTYLAYEKAQAEGKVKILKK